MVILFTVCAYFANNTLPFKLHIRSICYNPYNKRLKGFNLASWIKKTYSEPIFFCLF